MARRARKIPPMELQLDFVFDAGVVTPPGGTSSWGGFVDIAQCLSLMNRKFLRQGQQYYVESWSLTSNIAAKGTVQTLSNTWVCSNAWEQALDTWLASQEQLENFDEIKGRYHDFKVFMHLGHTTAGVSANLLPEGYDPAAVALISGTAGAQWDASEIVIPNDGGVGVVGQYPLHMVGPDAVSKGIIEGYANARARPQLDDPNIVDGTSWMTKAFDLGDIHNEINADVQDKNDSPPYFIDEDTAFEFYPGGSNAANGSGSGIRFSRSLTVNPIVSSESTRFGPGFLANCGLLYVGGTIVQAEEGAPASALRLTLTVAPGSYKGVMSRPMQDVN